MNDKLKEKLDMMPNSPGCYIYKDIDGNVLYVGKAKNLNSRVHQYFDRVYFNKTANLVKQIDDVEFVLTLSEKEALVLEINLIKQYMPPFNVIFMDDKHYPYISLSKEKYPRLSIRRDAKSNKYRHYGPFPDSKAAYKILNLLNRIYPFRKCKNMPKHSCLYQHMNQCLAPCVLKIDDDAYDTYIRNVDKFFKGYSNEITKDLNNKMYQAAEELNFEKAQEYKELIANINSITSKQIIEFNDKVSRDIVGFYIKENFISISILMYRNGYLNAKINEVLDLIGESNEIIETYLMQFYDKHDIPKEIYITESVNLSLLEDTLNIKLVNPKASSGQQLLLMAVDNASKSLEAKFIELASKDEDIFATLASFVNKNRISTIEMCDMSHISGDSAVGVVVVYQNGYPVKNKYRKFNIKGENTKDDLASTYEVIYRRFNNLLKDNQPLCDMLIVDGGINQMKAAMSALEKLNITNVIVCGLAKDDHHRTRAFITNEFVEIQLAKDSKLFLFLMRMQDEVHRYAITFFKNKKAKSMISSILDDVKGLGEVRKNRLLRLYHSLDEIKHSNVEQLSQIMPSSVAKELLEKINKEL
ncbi:MAG: excinuclease ABC subunit UvrC [Erysipelotrichaceae bacterium]|nr:excinuclease ABC subunit UvrC [Erysipelotrichaceae bacterium]